MRILIIANSRFKGGTSGGDCIYESFVKYWPCQFNVSTMLDIDYSPFFICYLHRIIVGCFRAVFDLNKYDVVYSASDFLPDSLPAVIYKIKGSKWIAGFYLTAFKSNKVHYWTQKVVRYLIEKLADFVIVTNPTMFYLFPDKAKTWINGGIELSNCWPSDEKKIYDAVFCGRIHPTKGIDELIQIWSLVRDNRPKARLAIIGDGDLGLDYVKQKIGYFFGPCESGIDLLGFMGNERFDIYRKSKVVLYPTPPKYDHFSMAPIEAMACGCPCISFKTETIKYMAGYLGWLDLPYDLSLFANEVCNISLNQHRIHSYKMLSEGAIKFAEKFDYKKQSMRVYEDFNQWFKGNGRSTASQGSKSA